MRKKLLLLLSLLCCLLAIFLYKNNQSTPVPEKKERADITDIHTDKARYEPGEPVRFEASLAERSASSLTITYMKLNKKIKTQTVPAENGKAAWSWQPPEDDFKGYLVKVQSEKEAKTIAVDVSSSWSVFPRYGFLSEFGDVSGKEAASVLKKLNRHHINGIQFYDWHYEHHQPLKMTENGPSPEWQDIAGRNVQLETVKHYIEISHEYGMNAMAYNLLYGAFSGAEKDGVKKEWMLFKDPHQKEPDFHPLPDDWKSDVILANSNDRSWQDYLIGRQKQVYQALDFDGWHIDQLGDRGAVYDSQGKSVHLADGFDEFIHYAKSQSPDEKMVMNAVNQYGQENISSAPADFLYTEVWDPYKNYGDLKKIIDDNRTMSDSRMNTVLAAYMNYDLSDKKGTFNPPGIFLTNSVIFASGGAHLELGEHMLSKEYFPHHQLKSDHELSEGLIRYYDFLTAYQTLLRSRDLKETENEIESRSDVKITSVPEKGAVWSFAKQNRHQKMLHFINFTEADSMEWRDTSGTQPEPALRKNVSIRLSEPRKIKNIWMASPDAKKGIPQTVSFTQKGNNVIMTLPSLKYWSMAVIEYDKSS
ncbi:glycoside hydrolase family 66 protein [Metabacillus indicus]|uniref:glycoside hydrolase family 66 protein n=1 Tax=Metabacillus indicus TaxID=246786 RepID=UPI002A007AF8|nr:glycoside hydrolase family 66 protein [Metabacillus indicus]MDX8291205.1 glycoside hydrolase family 66 protein [Metabacillus indicus]